MMSIRYWKISIALLLFIGGFAIHAAPAQTLNEPELPRLLLDTTYQAPTGNIINVAAGGNFQAALNAANPGDVIVLQAGATYTGNFTLPYKTGNEWIVIRSSAENDLPAANTRVQPTHSTALPKLVSANAAAVIATANAAHHYRFIGIEFGLKSGVNLNYGLVVFGSSSQNTLAQVPHDLILDRCYIHGNATGDVSRGVAMNCARAAVMDSYIANIHGVGFDTQAIAAWNAPGPLKIVNNYLEGAGENIMFGGADPKLYGLVISDVEIRRNHLSKPLSWNPRDPSYAGIHWSVKNIFELKNAQRILVEGNLFEYNWMDGQNGTAILFTPRNQEGTAPWSTVQDVTFTNNIVRHTAAGVNFLGTDYNFPSQRLQRIKVKNNLFVDVGNPSYGTNNVLFYVLNGTTNITLDHNTAFQSGNVISADGQAHTGFVYTNNLTPHNTYGVIGSGSGPGKASLNVYFPNCVFLNNILTGGSASVYPKNNFFPSTLDAVGFVDRAAENYRLAITSLYHNAGTDSQDIGADLDAIAAAMSIAATPPPPPLNQPPVVTANVSALAGIAPLALSFACTASDPDGAIVSYLWDFGDAQTAATAAASHTYQNAGNFTAQITVTDNAGATASASVTINVTNPVAPPPPPTADVVLYAAESVVKVGNWQVVADPTAAGGSRLRNPDQRGKKLSQPQATPRDYFEVTFNAQAGVPYRLWVRGKADNNSQYNDSFYVQFDDSVTANGASAFRIGTTDATVINLEEYLNYGLNGWGWQDNGWGINVLGPFLYFQTSGTHTLRLQPREDGFSIDQIVLSPLNYLLVAPGGLKNDNHILPKNSGR
ncbi:MAG: PKD domain-containing protein [Acidobacteria bacterium]|nr:PKD domain-containing protein [Acidobacteriota bacterium]